MEKLYLSRRNIVTLLEKLDTARAGQTSTCTIIKNDHAHGSFPQTMRRISVTAVEEGNSYTGGVSPRVRIARSNLSSLLAGVDGGAMPEITIDGLTVIAVDDSRYYDAAHSEKQSAIGHITNSLLKKWR